MPSRKLGTGQHARGYQLPLQLRGTAHLLTLAGLAACGGDARVNTDSGQDGPVDSYHLLEPESQDAAWLGRLEGLGETCLGLLTWEEEDAPIWSFLLNGDCGLVDTADLTPPGEDPDDYWAGNELSLVELDSAGQFLAVQDLTHAATGVVLGQVTLDGMFSEELPERHPSWVIEGEGIFSLLTARASASTGEETDAEFFRVW